MTTRTVSAELTPAQRQAFEEAVERHGKSFFANADLIWDTLLGAAGGGWQPIETAPRDGTAVLVIRAIWPGLPVGHAQECNGHNTYVAQWWGDKYGGRWVCYMDLIQDPDCPIDPTHWMPLPASPKPTDTAEKEVGDGT